jgi:hypothetical protein
MPAGNNDFPPFAVDTGANVLTPSAWAALTALVALGFQTGTASAAQVNTALRLAMFGTAAIAKIVSDAGEDADDDGDVAAFASKILLALGAQVPPAIGCLLMRRDNVDPATLYPGTTWTLISRGQALVGWDDGGSDPDFATVGATTGSKTKTLTAGNLPTGDITNSAVLAGHNTGSTNGGSDITKGYMVGDSGSSSPVTMHQSAVNLNTGTQTAVSVVQESLVVAVWERAT